MLADAVWLDGRTVQMNGLFDAVRSTFLIDTTKHRPEAHKKRFTILYYGSRTWVYKQRKTTQASNSPGHKNSTTKSMTAVLKVDGTA